MDTRVLEMAVLTVALVALLVAMLSASHLSTPTAGVLEPALVGFVGAVIGGILGVVNKQPLPPGPEAR